MPSKSLVLFKYPGGKSKLVSQIRHFIDPLIKLTGEYYEPFIGGGPVLLDIINDPIFRDKVKFYVNDKDETVYSFWNFLSNSSDEDFAKLINLIDKKPTIEIFYEEREKEKLKRDELTKAYHCVFFHKTTFNGMYNGSPIGGKKQESVWKVGCHYTPKNLIKKIIEARKRVKGRLHVENKDINNYLSIHNNNGAMYLDPPYFTMGHGLYPVNMGNKNINIHQQMASFLMLRKNWVLSYDNCSEIKEMYKWAKIELINAWYSSTSFNKKKNNIILDDNGKTVISENSKIEKRKCETKTELIILSKIK